jgi:MFS family permease
MSLVGRNLALPRTVLLLQAGNAVNAFGYGLILPFEIIYLHTVRGFGTATAGLVLSTVMGTAAAATPPVGALLDRFRAKPVILAGSLASAAGYGGLSFVAHPWQAFLCSVAAGIGQGAGGAANPTLLMTLVTASSDR